MLCIFPSSLCTVFWSWSLHCLRKEVLVVIWELLPSFFSLGIAEQMQPFSFIYLHLLDDLKAMKMYLPHLLIRLKYCFLASTQLFFVILPKLLDSHISLVQMAYFFTAAKLVKAVYTAGRMCYSIYCKGTSCMAIHLRFAAENKLK